MSNVAPVASAVAPSFDAIPKTGTKDTLKTKECIVFKKLQARTDTDSGSVVDEGRCQQFAVAMTAGAKFPPIKVMKVLDAPGMKDTEVHVTWDGMHTLRGAEIAKIPEIEALVWSGTWAQAQYLAATRANREHEANGKPLSSKDKIHAVSILANAYKTSEIPKKDWPSNRAAADTVGCSRQLVNDMDPFDRGAGNVREVKAAAKRGERAAAAAPKAEPHWEVVNKVNQNVIASYDAKTEKEALDIHKGHHPASDLSLLVARKQKPAAPVVTVAPDAAPGSEKVVGFDWAGMDGNMGYLIRGFEGASDLFGLKDTPEFKEAKAALNTVATYLNALRKKHGKKKAEAAPAPAAK